MRFLSLALVSMGLTLTCAACDAGLTDTPTTADADALLAAPQKVPICHYDDAQDAYVLLLVPAPALSAHQKHGDLEIGEPIPGMEGFILGETCEPVGLLTACLDFTDRPNMGHLFINTSTGEISGIITGVVTPLDVTGSVTDPTGGVGSIDAIQGLNIVAVNPDNDPDAGGCDNGLVDSITYVASRTGGNMFTGDLLQICDHAVNATYPNDPSTFTEGPCPSPDALSGTLPERADLSRMTR